VRSEEPIQQNAHTKIVAEPGDRFISASIDTNAEQFPCNYKIQLVLVFAAEESLRERYIERRPICP
jgi:hypothetical protein